MEIEQADTQVVEDLIARMLHGMQSAHNFSAADGLSAALTFAFRFCKVVVSLSGDSEARRNNSMLAAGALRRMAAQIDMEQSGEGKETIH